MLSNNTTTYKLTRGTHKGVTKVSENHEFNHDTDCLEEYTVGTSRTVPKYHFKQALPPRGGRAHKPIYRNRLNNHTAVGRGSGDFYATKTEPLNLDAPEEARIAKLLRRLNAETNQDNSLLISQKLLDVLTLPDNYAYCRKAFHILSESMYEILHICPGPMAKQRAARCLGRMGYNMALEADFNNYQNWLFGRLPKTNDDCQMLLIGSLLETLECDRQKPILHEYVDTLLRHLIVTIEVTDGPDVFLVILDVLIQTTVQYPDSFQQHFRDTVDLVFGWHVDQNQPFKTIETISVQLQKIPGHFQANFTFSLMLLENFLEDIVTFSRQLHPDTNHESLDHVTVLIMALNTILKCLGTKLNTKNGSDLITNCLNEILKIVPIALYCYSADNLLITVNNTLALLLPLLVTKPAAPVTQLIYQHIDLELEMYRNFDDTVLVSILNLVCVVVTELSTNLPLNLIPKLIGPDSLLLPLRLHDENPLLAIYQTLLNVKNVAFLQEVYRYIIGDLVVIYDQLLPGTVTGTVIVQNPFMSGKSKSSKPEMELMFLIRCLAQLVNSSSIIVMWALKPSILELVGVHLKIDTTKSLIRDHPMLHYSLLYFLYTHCKCYNNFMSCSNLLGTVTHSFVLIADTSNLGNFEHILRILEKLLKRSGQLHRNSTILLLVWLNDILRSSDCYLDNLYDQNEFKSITEALIQCGYSFDRVIITHVWQNLDSLLVHRHLNWPDGFLRKIADLCRVHIDSSDITISKQYTELYTKLPWDLSIVNCITTATKSNSNHMKDQLSNNAIWYGHRALLNNAVTMTADQFKIFIDYLLMADSLDDGLVDSLVVNCMYQMSFVKLATYSRRVQRNWLCADGAQYCVNAKLRTALGKPNETFTKIESGLQMSGLSIGKIMTLLTFVDYLDKAMFNAAEGCASTTLWVQPQKSVRNFFLANTGTCNEWLGRNRISLAQMALRIGWPQVAVRHCYLRLRDLQVKDDTGTGDFHKLLVLTVTALLQLQEPDALVGLYNWVQSLQTIHDLVWLKYGIEQAKKRYENALNGYLTLTDSNPTFLGQFITDQIVECLKALGNWEKLRDWMTENNRNDTNSDLTTCKTVINLSMWQDGSDIEHKIQRLTFVKEPQEAVITDLRNQLQIAIRTSFDTVNTVILQQLLVQEYVLNALIGRNAANAFLVSENFENDIDRIDGTILNRILWWSEMCHTTNNSTFTSNLRVNVINRARKQENYQLALNQINRYLQSQQLYVIEPPLFANTVITNLLPMCNTTWTLDLANVMKEMCKLCWQLDTDRKRTYDLTVLVAVTALNNGYPMVSSKLLLKLTKWLQLHQNNNDSDYNTDFKAFLNSLPDEFNINNGSGKVGGNGDIVIGKLLQCSVKYCPNLPKNWMYFGTWCYRWGRHMSNDPNTHLISDFEAICSHPSDSQQVIDILNVAASDDELIDTNPMTVVIRNKLSQLSQLSPGQIDSIVDVWQKRQTAVYRYYALSAEAYFKYLQLCTNSNRNGCDAITIILRLLRLTVKYAYELQTILEDGYRTTPTNPWKFIVPQLFARLNHPETYVRQIVSDLLCRIAADQPHLIIFPAVVGALEGGGLKFALTNVSDTLSTSDDAQSDDEDVPDDVTTDNNGLQACFKAMVDILSAKNSETIAQVQTLVRELRRIALLWDELVLGTLTQYQNDICKRQTQLDQELDKVRRNTNLNNEERAFLMREKYRIITQPVLHIMKRLLEVVSRTAETPYEQQFQERHLSDLQTTTVQLETLQGDGTDAFKGVKQLQKSIQGEKSHQRHQLMKLSKISPVLSDLKQTVISMPGHGNLPVSIDHVWHTVTVLPTKTKPKKLIFYGTNGQSYAYLLKGMEDLHLDERIMQFLTITNHMMMGQEVSSALYRARHYPVIPLGPRSGLISWVDGTIPVFAFYKRWQQRRELSKMTDGGTPTTTTSYLRPSDVFYNKLNPLLKEHGGVKNVENRKEWPLTVLIRVLNELMAETPSDLLAKELWMYSVDPGDWWQVTKTYSVSVAVMSMIGYVIGLGDRHLDNVLVDLNSGEVVHIDYNVCFEKGKTLRVPEKVPFRLTQNFRGALGTTGIEGIYRAACENTLRTMRKGRETLLTLLEAFVYDPLIDWTVGGEVLAGTTVEYHQPTSGTTIKQTKRDLDRDLTQSMYTVRCLEMKSDWLETRDKLIDLIRIIMHKLDEWLELNTKLIEKEEYLKDLHQQMALVKEAEVQFTSQHPLFTLPLRYDAHCRTKDALEDAREALEKVQAFVLVHLERYEMALHTTAYDKSSIQTKLQPLDVTLFGPVTSFLQTVGKNDVIQTYTKLETDLKQSLLSHRSQLINCYQLLMEYRNVIGELPQNSYQSQHRLVKFRDWLELLLKTTEVTTCERIYREFTIFLDTPTPSDSNLMKLQRHYDNCNQQLDVFYTILQEINVTSVNTLYDSARNSVKRFLKTSTTECAAYQFVIANELYELNTNFLSLETAASRTGDLLVQLTSKDGDWYLYDLMAHAERVTELIDNYEWTLLGDSGVPVDLPPVFECVKVTNRLYKGLYDLYYNFRTIILPESVKKVQNEDDSVLQQIDALNQLIGRLDGTVPDLIRHLEGVLPCLFMQLEIPNESAQLLDNIGNVRTAYQTLVSGQNMGKRTTGQMLLMGFNGLFEKVGQEMVLLLQNVNKLNVPVTWRKIDQVQEAKSIGGHIFAPHIYNTLDLIFFLKRLDTIQTFFRQLNTVDFTGADSDLDKPIRQFIADCIGRLILGLNPEMIAYTVCTILTQLSFNVSGEIEQTDVGAEHQVALRDICRTAWNSFIRTGRFTQNLLSQATSLALTLRHTWSKRQEPERIEKKIRLTQSSQHRLQFQLQTGKFMTIETVRRKFIKDLQMTADKLSQIGREISQLTVKQKTVIDDVVQRLNWAKVANPKCTQVLNDFEMVAQRVLILLSDHKTIETQLIQAASCICEHEMLRAPSTGHSDNHVDGDSRSLDAEFLQALEQWRTACQLNVNAPNNCLLPIEETIMRSLSTHSTSKSANWLNDVSDVISLHIEQYQDLVLEDKSRLMAVYDSILRLYDTDLKVTFTRQTNLVGTLKAVLKSLGKLDGYSPIVIRFQSDYRHYTEAFSKLFSALLNDNTTEEMSKARQNCQYILDRTTTIFDTLLELKPVANSDLETVASSVRKNSTTQLKNSYALNVWRRVKQKLDGRDPDTNKKSSIHEQVDWVIREATDIENLALLYEGWTPWV